MEEAVLHELFPAIVTTKTEGFTEAIAQLEFHEYEPYVIWLIVPGFGAELAEEDTEDLPERDSLELALERDKLREVFASRKKCTEILYGAFRLRANSEWNEFFIFFTGPTGHITVQFELEPVKGFMELVRKLVPDSKARIALVHHLDKKLDAILSHKESASHEKAEEAGLEEPQDKPNDSGTS